MSLAWQPKKSVSPPALLLFDLDGTLVDSLPDLATAVNRVREVHGLPGVNHEQVGNWIGNGSNVLIKRAMTCMLDEQVVALSETQMVQAHERFLLFYAQEFCQRSRLFDGVLDCLQSCREQAITLAVVTNKPMQFVTPLLQHLHVADYFSLLLGGDSLARKKPDPLPLLHACHHLNHRIAETWMVGDSRNDIDAAKAASMSSVAYAHGYNHGEPVSLCQPDYLLDNLRELPLLWSQD